MGFPPLLLLAFALTAPAPATDAQPPADAPPASAASPSPADPHAGEEDPHETRTPEQARQVFNRSFERLRGFMPPGTADAIVRLASRLPPGFFQQYANAMEAIENMKEARAAKPPMQDVAAANRVDMREHLNIAASMGPEAARVVQSLREAYLASVDAGAGGGRVDPTDVDIARATGAQFPDSPQIQQLAGGIQAAAGDARGAMESFNRAVALDPGNVPALAGRAQLHYDQEDFRRAFEDSLAALQRDPKNASALAVYQMSKTRVREVPDLPGRSPRTVSSAELAAVGPASARTAPPSGPAAALRRPPGRLVQDAQAALRGNNHAEAERKASLALARDPGDLDALYVRALARTQGGRLQDALADVQQGLKAPKADGRAQADWLVVLANVYNRLRDYRRAEEAARAALRIDPRHAAAHLSLAWAVAGQGRRTDAMQALQGAARLEPRYRDYYEAAMKLPDDSSLALLFGDGPAAARPVAPAGAGPERLWRRATMVLAGLLAGSLLLWRRLDGGGWRTRVRTVFQRSPVATLPAADPAGVLRSLYEVERRIGAGGMGVVYRALDRRLGRRVAIKQMRPEIRSDARERARFLDEARLVAALKHPNVVEIFSIVEDGAEAYLVFEYVDGKTVSEMLAAHKRLPPELALKIARDVAAALDYAHGRGVIHRDLKPSNVMVDSEGRAKVMDFGVARQAKESMSRISVTDTIAGTPPYMAPEQERGVVRRESDVYALAVCLYEMLTGRLPFDGVGAGMAMAKLQKAYPAPSTLGLPPALDAVFARAFEPDPDRRWPRAGDLCRAFGVPAAG